MYACSHVANRSRIDRKLKEVRRTLTAAIFSSRVPALGPCSFTLAFESKAPLLASSSFSVLPGSDKISYLSVLVGYVSAQAQRPQNTHVHMQGKDPCQAPALGG